LTFIVYELNICVVEMVFFSFTAACHFAPFTHSLSVFADLAKYDTHIAVQTKEGKMRERWGGE